MPASDLVAYLLLAAGAVAVAVLLYEAGAALGTAGRLGGGPARRRTLRRCEVCALLWKAHEDDLPSVTSLRVRRALRRALRFVTGGLSKGLPASWDRCPRCLSGQVRASRAS